MQRDGHLFMFSYSMKSVLQKRLGSTYKDWGGNLLDCSLTFKWDYSADLVVIQSSYWWQD